MTNTQITIYTGLDTVGGVVAEISYGTDRVICEIGTGYSPESAIYDGIVRHRSRAWLADALRTHQAPPVPGLYPLADGGSPAQPGQTAVLVSHLHLDHMSAMGFVDNSIPVYISEPALRIERALQDIGQGVHPYHTNYQIFGVEEPINVGAIRVLPIMVTDASYQDYSFLITTPDTTIHYTGDLALHYARADLTWAEMHRLADQDVHVQLLDVTTLMDDTLRMIYGTTEPEIVASSQVPEGMMAWEDVLENYRKLLLGHEGAAVVNIYERETADVDCFTELAEDNDRTFVLEPETGYIWWRFTGKPPAIYLPDYPEFDVSSRPGWLTALLEAATVVEWDEVVNNPGAYLVQTTYPRCAQLFDLAGADGMYIHDGGIPIGAFDPAYANLRRIIDMVGMRYVTAFMDNFFGHGYPSQVRYYAEQIGAHIVMPVHSMNPERFKMSGPSQVLVARAGVTYTVVHEEGRAHLVANS